MEKSPIAPNRVLHSNVTLAEGLIVPDLAWTLHGNVLCEGIRGHKVRITGFPIADNGRMSIQMSIWPLSSPEPLRTRES